MPIKPMPPEASLSGSRPIRLLIDGYNVLSPSAPPKVSDSMWLRRERMSLINRLIKHLPNSLGVQTSVIFDAANPPPDRPSRFIHGGIEVRFAVDFPEADDLLEELIAANHHPKQLTVVSSDHRVQAACKRRGATAFDSQPWLDRLLDGTVMLAKGMNRKFQEQDAGPNNGAGQGGQQKSSEDLQSQEDVKEWMREFGFDSD